MVTPQRLFGRPPPAVSAEPIRVRLPAVVQGGNLPGFDTSLEGQARIDTARAMSDELLTATRAAMPKATSADLAGTQIPTGGKAGGTSIGEHARINGKKVMLKPDYPGDLDMNVRDAFANTLRKAAGSPSLAVAEGTFPITAEADPLVIKDYARARINGLDEAFTNRVKDWTPEQRITVAQDMVWSLFLEDFDKGTRQYKVIELPAKPGEKTGVKGVASGDWDQSAVELPKGEGQTGVDKPLDRFTNFSNFPTAQNLAFIEHVHGRSPIDVDVMRATVQQLKQNLKRPDFEAAIEPYLQKHYGTLPKSALEAKRGEIADQVQARLDHLEPVTEGFIRLLESETTERANRTLPLGARIRTGFQDSLLRAKGKFGASKLMNITVNKSSRTLRTLRTEIPTYRASDPNTQVGTIKAKALLKVMESQADAFEAAKKAKP